MEILKYSGIMSVIITWILVVLPVVRKNNDIYGQSISSASSSNNTVRIVSIGLILRALFQAMFLVYLSQIEEVQVSSLSILVYFTTILATITTALFPLTRNPKIHNLAVKYFFVVYPITMVLIGLEMQNFNQLLTYLSILLTVCYFVGMIVIFKKFGLSNALAEIWAFFVISIWIVCLTLVL